MMWPLTWNQTSWSVNSLRTKLVEVDGIPAELFQILKSDVVKVLHSTLPANLENSAVTTGLQKVSFHSKPKERQYQRCSDYHRFALISHASKVMLKILQVRLQQYMNCELPDVQAGFRKGRGTRDQIASIHWIIEKAREFQENIYFCFTDYAKAFDCVDHN